MNLKPAQRATTPLFRPRLDEPGLREANPALISSAARSWYVPVARAKRCDAAPALGRRIAAVRPLGAKSV